MFRPLIAPAIIAAAVVICCGFADMSRAEPGAPQAPASFSWLPHGYGGDMWIHNTKITRKKGAHGFRNAPSHTGSWSQPLWGWDVNGYYHGPQVPEVDPAMCQLPIGLLYPENGPMMPPPQKIGKIRKVHK